MSIDIIKYIENDDIKLFNCIKEIEPISVLILGDRFSVLNACAFHGSLRLIKHIRKHFNDYYMYHIDDSGKTPLISAIMNYKEDTALYIIATKNVTNAMFCDEDALSMSILNGLVDVFNKLKECKWFNLRRIYHDGNIVYKAVLYGSYDMLNIVLDLHLPFVSNYDDILTTAVDSGDINKLRRLLNPIMIPEYKIDINEYNDVSMNTLSYAAYSGYNDMCKLLLDKGAIIHTEKSDIVSILGKIIHNRNLQEHRYSYKSTLNVFIDHHSFVFHDEYKHNAYIVARYNSNKFKLFMYIIMNRYGSHVLLDMNMYYTILSEFMLN